MNAERGTMNEKQKAVLSFQFAEKQRCLLLKTENSKLKTDSSFRVPTSSFRKGALTRWRNVSEF
jgi:hypothetical protein